VNTTEEKNQSASPQFWKITLPKGLGLKEKNIDPATKITPGGRPLGTSRKNKKGGKDREMVQGGTRKSPWGRAAEWGN